MSIANRLLEKIERREARAGVVGLGYVGLPLAVEFARAGLTTVGIDLDVRKVDEINAGHSYIPDMPYIVSAAEQIAKHLHKGQLVVLESTTYPGTTAEVLQPMFEATGLKVGRDFFLAFSPERVDPGNERFNTRNVPKVVGGTTR